MAGLELGTLAIVLLHKFWALFVTSTRLGTLRGLLIWKNEHLLFTLC